MRAAVTCRASPAGGDTPSRRASRWDRNSLPSQGAEGWQISNPPVLSTAPLLASLEVFQRAGLARLREKSIALTAYFERLIEDRLPQAVEIITPPEAHERGSQLSLRLALSGAPGEALPRAPDRRRRVRRLARAGYRAPGPRSALQLVPRRVHGRRRSGPRGRLMSLPSDSVVHRRRGSDGRPARDPLAAPRCARDALREPAGPARRRRRVGPIHQSGARRSRHPCAQTRRRVR